MSTVKPIPVITVRIAKMPPTKGCIIDPNTTEPITNPTVRFIIIGKIINIDNTIINIIAKFLLFDGSFCTTKVFLEIP